MSRWQIRPAYFKGAATYTFGTTDGETIQVVADAEGYFELTDNPKGPLGVFAKRAHPILGFKSNYRNGATL